MLSQDFFFHSVQDKLCCRCLVFLDALQLPYVAEVAGMYINV
jgi:hypothetical protein